MVALFAVFALFPSEGTSQTPAAGPTLRTSAIELSVGGRVQTQFNTTSVDDAAPSQLFIRRARIELGVRMSDRVSGVIQPDFGNDDVDLKDTYLKLALSPGLELLAGKAYRPFGLLEQTSSKRILPIERGLRIRGLSAADEYGLTSGLDYSDRDIGVQVLGAPEAAPAGLTYAAGVFRGPLHGMVGAQDSYQYAARVTARAADDVRVGLGWSSRHFAEDDSETPELRRGDAFEVDFEYGSFAPGLHVLVELATGDVQPFSDETFRGAQAWLAYRTRDRSATVTAVEPVLRLSWADQDAEASGLDRAPGTLVTPGLNLHLGPLNRIMINYDMWVGGDGSPDAQSFKAMFQLGF
jgi:hypothetical protein